MKHVWIWQTSMPSNIVGGCAFLGRQQAIDSLMFSCHKIKDRPEKVADSQEGELWRAPTMSGDTIRWEILTLKQLFVHDRVEHL